MFDVAATVGASHNDGSRAHRYVHAAACFSAGTGGWASAPVNVPHPHDHNDDSASSRETTMPAWDWSLTTPSQAPDGWRPARPVASDWKPSIRPRREAGMPRTVRREIHSR